MRQLSGSRRRGLLRIDGLGLKKDVASTPRARERSPRSCHRILNNDELMNRVSVSAPSFVDLEELPSTSYSNSSRTGAASQVDVKEALKVRYVIMPLSGL